MNILLNHHLHVEVFITVLNARSLRLFHLCYFCLNCILQINSDLHFGNCTQYSYSHLLSLFVLHFSFIFLSILFTRKNCFPRRLINRRDLMEVSKRLGAGYTYKDIDEMMAEVDKDGDGFVQFDGEYRSIT